jgi:hypothetical protein
LPDGAERRTLDETIGTNSPLIWRFRGMSGEPPCD